MVVDAGTGAALQERVGTGRTTFPYVPGLLAFREMPGLLDVLGALDTGVDLLLCAGQGLAHPRRCRLACHLGVLTGLAARGRREEPLRRPHDAPGPRRVRRADHLSRAALRALGSPLARARRAPSSSRATTTAPNAVAWGV